MSGFAYLSQLTPQEEKLEETIDVPEETLGEAALRHTARSLKRVGEVAFGTPGNLRKLAFEGIGENIPVVGKIAREKRDEEHPLFDALTGKWLPTSSDLREGIGILSPKTPEEKEALEAWKNYTEPFSEGEEFADEVVANVASLFMPGTGALKGPLHTAGRLATGFGGAAAKQVAKTLGLGPEGQTLIEAGTDLLGLILNERQFGAGGGGLRKTVRREYNQAKQSFTPNDKGAAAPLENDLMNLKLDLQKRGEELNDFIEKSAVNNPQGLKEFREAQKAFSTMEKGTLISNWVEKEIGKGILSKGAAALMGSSPLLLKGVAGKTLGAAYALNLGSRVLYRVAKSPLLRKYYMDMTKAVSKGDYQAFAKNFQELDKRLRKEEDEGERY